MTVVT